MKNIILVSLLAFLLFNPNSLLLAQTTGLLYYPKLPHVELSDVKTKLTDILKQTWARDTKKGNLPSFPKSVSVFDDRIEMVFKKYNKTIYFSDLIDYPIEVKKCVDIKGGDQGYCSLELKDWAFSGDKATELADYLFFFQYHLTEKLYGSQLILFKPVAEEYRALIVKPAVPEDQRKYIVQANMFNQEKKFDTAIEMYNKVIEVDQTTYPAAYSNLALLSAQLNKYNAAIFYMKKYLLLEPESADARSAQDKIYEWEAKIGK